MQRADKIQTFNDGNLPVLQYASTKRSEKQPSCKKCDIQGGGQEMAVMVG